MFENDALQLLATSEYNVFKLNDIITNRHDTPAPSTSISQIYLSQVTINIISSKYSFHYFVLRAYNIWSGLCSCDSVVTSGAV